MPKRTAPQKKVHCEMLEYDLRYIKNISLALDLLIIFYTIKTVLFRRGGR